MDLVWKLVCDGYCKDSSFMQGQQWNPKVEYVLYNNFHNKDTYIIIDLNFTKQIWDRLQHMHEGDTSSKETLVAALSKKEIVKYQCLKLFSMGDSQI